MLVKTCAAAAGDSAAASPWNLSAAMGRPLLVVGMNFIPRPLAIGMRFIPMDGGCLPHWDEALDESTGIIEAVYFAF